jgi:(S)-3,5-dihydroxyphenylglycine transaminase
METTRTDAVRRIEPNEWLTGDGAGAMDFLNGIAERFPGAISLAAGRPPDSLVRGERTRELLTSGIASEARRLGIEISRCWARFAQYSDTNGIVFDALRRLLKQSEDVDVDACWLQVTNGIQEALLIECLLAKSSAGAVIAFDPTYVGIAGASAFAGLPLYVVPRGDRPVNAIAEAIRVVRQKEKGPILCYVVADHDNPTGLSLRLSERQALVDLARREDFIVLEDTAYRLFNYDHAKERSLFSLAEGANVVHMVSFSKTFMPGLRLGFTARKQASATSEQLNQLTSIKSFVSVTTAPIAQAILAGFLDRVGYDLDGENSPRKEWCKANRDVLTSALQEGLGDVSGVKWNIPAGGFFLSVDLPFDVDMLQASTAAEQYGVVILPMRAFSPTGRMGRTVRLAFSSGDPATIAEGARRFSQFVCQHLSVARCSTD